MVGADALVQGSLRRGVGTRGAGFFGLRRRGRLRVGGVLCRGGRSRCRRGRLLYRRHDLRGLLGGLRRGCRGLHGMGGRLSGSALRDRDRAGLVSCCGRLAAAGSGSGLGCCGRCDRGAHAVLPVPVAAEPILLGLGFRLAGGLALSLAALDLLQHGAALRGGVPRAARRDDAAAAGGITAPGRGLLRCAGLLFRGRGRWGGGRLAGLHGGKGGLDLGAGGALLRHGAGDLEHLPGDVWDN